MSTQITPVQEVRQTLMKMEDQFKHVLPSYITPEKFMQVVVTAVQLKPDLLNLDRSSLYSSCLACASDGLIPDGREAALLPYKGKIAYQPMVGGLMKLIRNSGELATIDSQTVFEGDQYESYTDERGPHFKHVKSREKRGKPILTFAYAITKDGSVYHEEITEDEMHKIEACSKTSEVWKGAFRDEQYRKSAIKRLAKRLPKSTDIERVIDRDNEQYDLVSANASAEEAKGKTTSAKLREAVDAGVEEAQIVKQEKSVEAVAETPVVKPAPSPVPVAPTPPPANQQQDVKTVQGVILKNTPEHQYTKIKTFVNNGKAGNKYGCKIAENWYGSFDTKTYDLITECQANNRLVNLEYKESPVTTDGKTVVYYNIVSLKVATTDDVKDF